MKFKHFAGLMLVLAVGGFFAYKIICRQDGKREHFDSEKDDDNSSVDKNETMYQAYENMNVRNEQAKQILSDIHDDMKKSEDNIASKKEDIAKMMEILRK